MASEDEFAEFVAGSLPRLLRFGHVLTGDAAAAEDLVQTALGRSLRAWRAHPIDDPHAYVRKVMVTSYASSWRRHAAAEVVTPVPAAWVPGVDEAQRVDDRDAVWRALRRLPPRQRAVIVLRYYEDLSEREIAAVMGTSAGTVKSQAARALRRLAGLFGQHRPGRGGERTERGMSDLEDRIRESLRDPRRGLPAWPDPMPRIRRAARRQRIRRAAGTGGVTAGAAVLAVVGILLASAAGPVPRRPAMPTVPCHSLGSGERARLGVVAFVRGRSLLVADLSTCKPRVVVPDGGRGLPYDPNPSFSPDGRWIEFGQGSVVATAGGLVTRPLGAVFSAAWSPSADLLAGVTTRRGLVVGGPGQKPRPVLPAGWGANVSLAFDPTGRQLAVTRYRFCTTPCPSADRGIWVVDARTGRAREVYRVPRGHDVSPGVAGWSPDGRWILFQPDPYNSASIGMDGLPLEAVPAAGGSRPVQVVSAMLWYLPGSTWCGGRLVVSAGAARFTFYRKHLVAAVPPAWHASPVSRNSALGWMQPACDPAGDWVAAIAAPNRNVTALPRPSGLWLLRGDGSSAHVLAGTGRSRYQMNAPQWSADGRWVLFARTTLLPRPGSPDLFLAQVDPATGRGLRLVGPVAQDATVFAWYRP